jgi:hypothetical protein
MVDVIAKQLVVVKLRAVIKRLVFAIKRLISFCSSQTLQDLHPQI